MNATSVASSTQMFSFSQQTQSSSPAVNPFAPRPAGEGASFGFGTAKNPSFAAAGRGTPFGTGIAGDSNQAKRSKGRNPFSESSDNEGRLKVPNPFKSKEGNLSDGGKQKQKRNGEGGKKGTDNRKNNKKPRDGSNKYQNQNGQAINGVHPATSAEEDNTSRPSSSSSASSIDEVAHTVFQSTDPFAKKVYDQLRRDGISPPAWPSQPGNPKHKAEMAKFREKYEEYRKKLRASLTKAGLIDDPNKRKTLQDAIDFRGICEDMCPEYEKITRITELDVPFNEKDPRTTFANTRRMVKKLARSAAGQEAPLPMDVRSTATLRRTLDYLIDDVLRNDGNLPIVHGFLWDRTRAIRRDFTFFSSPTADDLKTQAYVLENIARFHVTALHLLSQPGKAGEDFVEQQELEQLGKALLSLRDLYDDCNAQDITCENEAEFRAYYLIFHGHDSNTMEMLQRQWKPHFWKDSDEIRTAVSLVEALQNTTDFHGPLIPAPSLAASNASHTFFRIVEDPSVSYTMACFAECHFPQVRKSILRAVKRAMARPKEASNDVTAATLNKFLRFDTVQEAIDFATLHDIELVPDEQAPTDPGRQFLVLNNKGTLPCPRLQHQFSQNLVERKRGNRSLPDTIHQTVNESSNASNSVDSAASVQTEGSLFVKDSNPVATIDPKAIEAKGITSPFTTLGQTPKGVGNGLTGGHIAAQPPSTTVATSSGNPFTGIYGALDTMKPSPFAPAGSANNAKPTTNSSGSNLTANAVTTNPFASSLTSQSGGAPSNPFGQLSSTPSTDLQGLKGQQQTKPFQQSLPSSEKPNNFTRSPPLGVNATTSIAPSPFAPSEKIGEGKHAAPGPFSALLKPANDGKIAPPSMAGIQDATQPFNTLASPTATNQSSNAGPPISSVAVPGSSISGLGLKLERSTRPAGQGASNFGGNIVPGNKPSMDRQPGSVMGPPLTKGIQSDLQSSAQTRQGYLTSHMPSSITGPSAPSTLGHSVVASTTPPSSPPRNITSFSHSKIDSAPSTPQPPRDFLGDFTRWFVKGDKGLMYEFEVFMLESTLRDVYDKFKKDEEERLRKEKEERDNAKAQKHRVYNLSLKYFYRWKELAREKRLKKLRQSGRDQFRAFREAQRAAQIKEEQEALQRSAKQKADIAVLNRPDKLAVILKSQNSKRQAEEALLASGVLSGVINEQETIAAILRGDHRPSPTPSINGDYGSRSRSGSIASTDGGFKTRALRERLLGAKPGRFRRSLPPMPGEISSPDRPQRVSKVSERWRLKAMGIVQMPDGTALPESMADEIRTGLRRDPGLSRSTSTRRSSIGTARNDSPFSITSTRREPVSDNSSITNKRKRSFEGEGGITKRNGLDRTVHKRVVSDADNLIRELRAMREEMEEGTTWFKSQNGKLQSDILSRGGTPLDESSI